MVLPEGSKIILRRRKINPWQNPNFIKNESDEENISPLKRPNNSIQDVVITNKRKWYHKKKVSNKKKIAQDLYYSNLQFIPNQYKLPAKQRLGFRQMQKLQLFYHPKDRFIKPRIRKTENGLETSTFAQRRLLGLRNSFKVRCENRPPFVHSLKHSLSTSIQKIIENVQLAMHTDHHIDDNLPIYNGDRTALSLHMRFSGYP